MLSVQKGSPLMLMMDGSSWCLSDGRHGLVRQMTGVGWYVRW